MSSLSFRSPAKLLGRGAVVTALIALSFTFPQKKTLYLIGDSTMADKPLVGNPERGWGQALPLFFRSDLVISNYARNGRSTKSFIQQGLWNDVVERLREGDFVMIQFGHNDAKKEDPSRYADPDTAYKANLRKFINDTRQRGAFPILITPVVRRRFGERGQFYDVHGRYPAAVREVGLEMNVPVIDLDSLSAQMLTRLGPERSKELYLWIPPGIFSGFPDGRTDNTHFSWKGARAVAELVVQALRRLDVGVNEFLLDSDPPPSLGMGKLVLLDYYYNNEWRTEPDGKLRRYHYVWEDTTNSGFSIAGALLARLGAEIDSLNVPPTKERLDKTSVYIIVDPDTPKETKHPEFIGQGEADVLSGWVRSGGVLVLMANDSGNCEFEHLNALARPFGIEFNEDSFNRVQGRDYDTGMFSELPDHPAFKGIKALFMKEVCSLSLKHPAKAMLRKGNLVVMAESRYGRGLVVAVGDPWLYNEYVDNRRLPSGYENAPACTAFFSWLLGEARPVL